MKIPISSQTRCLLLMFTLAGLVSIPASAQTPTPTPISNGKIAFTSGNGNPEIYIMDVDGLNWTRLTNNTAFESTPAWSPDGTKIAFTSDRDSSLDIYVMDANGANPVRLTTNPNTDENPAWSLDGTKIAFHSNRDGNYEIYVMDANGANQTRLTNHASSDESPAWSPDGTKIVFASLRDGGNAEVYVMDANGSNPVRLTNHPDVSDGPAWSPDGTKIIFHRGPTGNSHIWIMDSNGANAVLLVTTNSVSGDSLPAWSPDGTKIVFRGTPFGGGEISVADANGSNPMNLTINNVNETDPDWQRILGPGPTPTPSPTATPFPTPTPGACGWANSALPMQIIESAVASLGGNLYTFGGTTINNVDIANSYKFDGTTWTTIASLPVALTGAAAVTDGTSLYVLGGYTITNVNVNTVYRYNPGSNTYTTLAPFAIASSAHAAAYLDGKIYKFCGHANSTPSPTSALEIYNIALNQWTAGANYPAGGGLASGDGFALGNFIYGVGGKTGGVPFQVDTALTCRYDPATNTWSDNAIADLPAPRARAATAAYNGGAVVAGGDSNGTALASALFWDPTSDTWSALPNMPSVRFNVNAAALGGSFYLVGGSSTAPYTNDFQRLTCPPGGIPTPTPSPTLTPPPPTPTPTLTPTPGICAWSAGPAYPIQIREAAVTSLNGNLYSFGGTSNNSVVANAYKFDGTTWTAIAPLPEPLAGMTAVNDGTNIYLPGGFNDVINSNRFYKYDPVANTYTTLEILTSPTARHGTAYFGGKVYKLCGSLLESFPVDTLEIYDIATNTWTSGANYPLSLNFISVFVRGNFIYAAGGFTFSAPGASAKAYRYDPATNTWDDAAIADLPDTRYDAAAAAYHGGAVLAGGTVGGSNSASVILWDPTSNTWSNLASMLGVHSKMNGAVLNGSFYVVGGRTIAFPTGSTDNQILTCPPAPTPTPTPTPAVTPSKLLNIATRMRVQTGENVLIGGFIINGTDSKNVIIRGIGPSLSSFFSGVLANPTLELFQGTTLLQSNNDWKDTQRIEIEATGLQPSDDFESAIVQTLTPGAYTAVVRGNGNTSGIGVVEAYDLNQTANSKLANIATRGFVEAGDNVMIGGLIIGPAAGPTARVVVRAIGPSLTAFGIAGALQDPTVELKDGNGTTLISNDEWEQGQPTEIQKLGLAPTDTHESALVTTLAPGAYTAIVRGVGNTTGVGLVEVYHVQ